MKHFYLAIKLIATAALVFNRLSLSHIGALAGAIDGIILYAIWSKQ